MKNLIPQNIHLSRINLCIYSFLFFTFFLPLSRVLTHLVAALFLSICFFLSKFRTDYLLVLVMLAYKTLFPITFNFQDNVKHTKPKQLHPHISK